MACFEKKISLSRCRLRQGLVSLFHIHTIVKKKVKKTCYMEDSAMTTIVDDDNF